MSDILKENTANNDNSDKEKFSITNTKKKNISFEKYENPIVTISWMHYIETKFVSDKEIEIIYRHRIFVIIGRNLTALYYLMQEEKVSKLIEKTYNKADNRDQIFFIERIEPLDEETMNQREQELDKMEKALNEEEKRLNSN